MANEVVTGKWGCNSRAAEIIDQRVMSAPRFHRPDVTKMIAIK